MTNRTFTPFPILNTERLTLRQVDMNDDQEIFQLRSDSEINKYLGRQKATTMDDARNFISRVNENIHKNDSIYWGITLNDNNTLIGTICLFSFSDEHDNCEIGYELLTNFQGKGIMTEALERVIEYAFATMNVERIEACFHKDNSNSVKLLERCSFRNVNEAAIEGELVYYGLKRQ